MALLDDQPPEEHRRRYDALLAAARERSSRGVPAASPLPLSEDVIFERETIPAGWYWTTRLARGTALRLVNGEATPGVSVLLWNADEPTERYNAADTVKVQWTARLRAGNLLLSDMGRVLASIIADDCGRHDTLLGGSTPASGQIRNSRDNFLRAAGKLGLGRRDIPPCITFFAGVQTDAAGRFAWREAATRPGDAVDLRAEMNLLVAVSNCPHPLAPRDDGPRAVETIVWQPPPAGADDRCRTGSIEAVQAFANTDRWFAG